MQSTSNQLVIGKRFQHLVKEIENGKIRGSAEICHKFDKEIAQAIKTFAWAQLSSACTIVGQNLFLRKCNERDWHYLITCSILKHGSFEGVSRAKLFNILTSHLRLNTYEQVKLAAKLMEAFVLTRIEQRFKDINAFADELIPLVYDFIEKHKDELNTEDKKKTSNVYRASLFIVLSQRDPVAYMKELNTNPHKIKELTAAIEAHLSVQYAKPSACPELDSIKGEIAFDGILHVMAVSLYWITPAFAASLSAPAGIFALWLSLTIAIALWPAVSRGMSALYEAKDTIDLAKHTTINDAFKKTLDAMREQWTAQLTSATTINPVLNGMIDAALIMSLYRVGLAIFGFLNPMIKYVLLDGYLKLKSDIIQQTAKGQLLINLMLAMSFGFIRGAFKYSILPNRAAAELMSYEYNEFIDNIASIASVAFATGASPILKTPLQKFLNATFLSVPNTEKTKTE